MQTNPEGYEKVGHVIAWINNRIRELRESRGLTQRQVAAIMSVSSGRYSDIESGRFEVKLTTVLRFMEAIGVKPDEFFRGCPGWKDGGGPELVHSSQRRKTG